LFLLLSLLSATAASEDDPGFTAVSIEPPYRDLLQGNRLLMETTGAKILKLPDGQYALIGVASTVLKDAGAGELRRAATVCQVKALRAVVGTTQGVQIGSVQRMENRLVVTIEDGKEKVKTVADYFSATTAKVPGGAKGMTVVGKWKSADGKTFYLAMGTLCDRKGDPVEKKP
jgi:hypothetical protein